MYSETWAKYVLQRQAEKDGLPLDHVEHRKKLAQLMALDYPVKIYANSLICFDMNGFSVFTSLAKACDYIVHRNDSRRTL